MIADVLRQMVEPMPAGSSVTLPVDWLREHLGREPEEPGGRPDETPLDVDRMAQLRGCSPTTIRSLCRGERISGAFRLGGSGPWRCMPDDFRRFVEGERSRPLERPSAPPLTVARRRSRRADLGAWRDSTPRTVRG